MPAIIIISAYSFLIQSSFLPLIELFSEDRVLLFFYLALAGLFSVTTILLAGYFIKHRVAILVLKISLVTKS
jgi:hypothetical protein